MFRRWLRGRGRSNGFVGATSPTWTQTPLLGRGAALLSRRDILAAGAASASLAWFGCGSDNVNPRGGQLGPPQLSWLGDARVAGYETHRDTLLSEVDSRLDELKAAHTNVVVLDTDFSFYTGDAVFEAEAQFANVFARRCHERGMKALAYYPILEVLTEDAENQPSMFKDHPEWVQIGIDRQPNVFVGGSGRVFWVPPGVESAWMCPTSEYVDYFTARVIRLAQTELDGVWGDVPLLSDIVGVWPCTNPSCAAKFLADTGLEQPTAVDWDSPTFRRWVMWRHQLIHDLEQTVLAAGRSVKPDFELIVETVTMDYSATTGQGLDGASHDPGDVRRVWEIDAVSDATSMRHATADDWLSMAVMMRHGRGCAGWMTPAPTAADPAPAPVPTPTWAIVYGKEEDDAERTMALAVVAGVCPYETQIPVLNSSVGGAYRGRMYGWLEENRDLWAGDSANAVAVLYSSASRNFLDRNSGVGLYTSLNAEDPLWWSTTASDSAKALPYIGEYRGICKALIHAHAPHDVVIAPRISAAALSRYRLVIAPQMVALSDAQVTALMGYVTDGGTLLITGAEPGIYEEDGARRGTSALLDAAGLSADPPEPWSPVPFGKGFVVVVADPPGVRFFNQETPEVLAGLVQLLARTNRQLVTTATAPMVFDVRKRGETRLQILCASLDGLGAEPFTPKTTTFRAQLDTGGRTVVRATVSAPDRSGPPIGLPTVRTGQMTSFDLTVGALAYVRIDLA